MGNHGRSVAHRRQTPKKRRFKGVKFLILLSCAVLVCLVFFASPAFHIAHIEISGSTVYEDDYLIRRMGIRHGDSIFFQSGRALERAVEGLPHIRSVRVTRQYPRTLYVNVSERIPRANVLDEQLNVFLLIDESGYVMETRSVAAPGLPVISGLRISGYLVGEMLPAHDPAALTALARISSVFIKNQITDIGRIDLSDPDDIRLFINNVTVHIGCARDADLLINWALACLAGMDVGVRGTLFAYDIDNTFFAFPR